jgi:peptidyl-Asp metalloendopeptidase
MHIYLIELVLNFSLNVNGLNHLLFIAGNYNSLRKSADIALLMTEPADYCGIAYLDAIAGGSTIGVVARDCATGYYSTGHEIGHLYGCYHNKETSGQNPYYPNAHGFWMNPPVNSGYRTILA